MYRYQILNVKRILEGYKERELTTDYLNRNQKSFYGKARLIECKDGLFLQSYETIVAMIDKAGQFHRLWPGYSATTAKHIDAFRRENGLPGLSKKEWDKMPVMDI